MPRPVLLAGLLSALALAAPASAASPPTGRLLVTLAKPAAGGAAPSPRAQASAARAVAARAGGLPAARAVPRLRLLAVGARAGTSLRTLRARLLADPRVARVEVEHRARMRYAPNDPALATPESAVGTDPGTPIEWWAARTGLPEAWDLANGAGAKVAVIDTGVDATHPDLAGRILAARDFSGTGPATEDQIGHGTHVASLACAQGNNGVGLVGAGLQCGLLVARTDFSDSSVAASIVWAVDQGADAITMSFGTDPGTAAPTPVRQAIDYAWSHGVVLAAAAADTPVEDQGYPASLLQPTGTGPDAAAGKGISVTAATAADTRASFAGIGSQISMAAYGAYGEGGGPPGIFGAFTSTVPSALERPDLGSVPPRPPCRCRTVFGTDARYAYLEGTSMATPMVAAIGALARHLNPDLGAGETARILKSTARRPAGAWTPGLGWGIVDAAAAVRAAAAIDRRAPLSVLRASTTRTRARSVLLRWTGSDAGPPGVLVSGVARYEIWRAVNGRPWRKLRSSSGHSLRVRVRPGSRYGFVTVAVDHAGNREPLPARPDARVTALKRR